jgi:hypothetical protein
VYIEKEKIMNLLPRWFRGYLYPLNLVFLLERKEWEAISFL